MRRKTMWIAGVLLAALLSLFSVCGAAAEDPSSLIRELL